MPGDRRQRLLAALEGDEAYQRLRENAVFQRLQAVEGALRAYRQPDASRERIKAALVRQRRVKTTGAAAHASKTRWILSHAYALLKSAETPMKTRDLVAALKDQGVAIGGQNPVTNLSAKLSADARFVNRRRRGWEIAPEERRVTLPRFMAGDGARPGADPAPATAQTPTALTVRIAAPGRARG